MECRTGNLEQELNSFDPTPSSKIADECTCKNNARFYPSYQEVKRQRSVVIKGVSKLHSVFRSWLRV